MGNLCMPEKTMEFKSEIETGPYRFKKTVNLIVTSILDTCSIRERPQIL